MVTSLGAGKRRRCLATLKGVQAPRHLSELRAELDRIDRELIELLAQRLDVCREVARAKEVTKARIIAPARVREIWNTRRAWAAEIGLDPAFAEQMFRSLLSETHRIESAEAEGRHPIPAPPEIAYDSALQLAATRIDHVVIGVSDLRAAEDFFVDQAGFVATSRSDNWVTVQAGAVTVVLRQGPVLTHIAIEVLDTEHARSDLAARGAHTGPTVVGSDGLEEFLLVSDPAVGVSLGVVSRTGDRAEADGSLFERLRPGRD